MKVFTSKDIMGLNKKFPRQPHTIIDPNVRWYPGSDI